MPSVQDCPYFSLERGKIAQAVADIPPVSCGGIAIDCCTSDPFSVIRTETRLPDSAGLYLRVRVLLI